MQDNLIHTIVRSRRRTLALEIVSDARLIVRAPHRASLDDIRRAVRKKLPWILEKQRLARERAEKFPQKEFIAGETFMFLGEPFKLSIKNDLPQALVFNGSGFYLRERDKGSARKLFTEWYSRRAFEIIDQRVRYYAGRHGLEFSGIRISNARKRWGSCGAKGKLSFSWRIVMAPMNVVDYVVVHELAHLVEKNHRSGFWAKVRGMLPEYRLAKAWLKREGAGLDV
ncbi:MAG: SprT family zinc-dependent metalloprotease [Candidatus Omnitrophica bacterium]|nr:SprT family zinc-dependent metalloprotease [Candidatus Omnitrophota bacterium]